MKIPNRLNYTVAMEITTQKEADDYFKKLVSWCIRRTGKDRTEIERIQRSNLGYFAGYYDSKTRRRVEDLFKCSHPIFGSIRTKGQPTSEEAFAIGLRMGKKIKNAIKKTKTPQPQSRRGVSYRTRGPEGANKRKLE